jgi:FtsP/CotA-like multicopper oxidase with cupredoxin domain/plastocyanin
VVDGWGYNGQVPGPELRVREGDTVRVRLHNRLPVPTTIHWHGIDVPLAQDGVPVISQPAVAPGSDFTYEFAATNPGTRWYHSHVDSNSQLELGLYGSFIVEPRAGEPVQYDREFTYLLDEKALDFTPDVALGHARLRNADTGNGRGGALQYDLFLINGKAGDAIPPLTIAQGERIRLRLINAGNLPHAMHLHGHSFTVIATDGNPVHEDARWLKDTVLIGPGERYDVEIDGTNPGVWMFHCHMPNHQDNGMMTVMVYDGFILPSGHDHGPDSAQALAPPPNQPAPNAPAPTAAPPVAAAGVSALRLVDNRFEPVTTTVSVGAAVTWTNDGTNLHNVSSFDGLFDSGAMLAGAKYKFTFTRAGTFRYYCRQHLRTGMTGSITVQ